MDRAQRDTRTFAFNMSGIDAEDPSNAPWVSAEWNPSNTPPFVKSMTIFLYQVPIVVPILVLLASIYLVIAPFYEAPLESFFCLLFILAGIPVYLIFVYFDIVPRSFFAAIGKLFFLYLFYFFTNVKRNLYVRNLKLWLMVLTSARFIWRNVELPWAS